MNVNSASLDTTCDGQMDSSQIVDVSGSDSESSSSEIDLDSIKKDSDCRSCRLLISVVDKLTREVDSLRKEVKSLNDQRVGDVTTPPSDAMNERINVIEERLGDRSTDSPSTTGNQCFEQRMREMEERLEDRTNRQLRQTLVIKNIPEGPDEKWKDTKLVLAGVISEALAIDEDAAMQTINRCHRGGSKDFYDKKKKHRPIYAAMMRWDGCEDLVQKSQTMPNVNIDYKYGPRTTIRRNMALQLRRQMKDEKSVGKAFVKFPAILMGIKPGEAKYSVLKDFSDEEVVLKPRRSKKNN